MKCYKCRKSLSGDEIGLHKKLVDRAAEEFLCIGCLADFFGCSEDMLYKKIESFRRVGCVLFPKKD